jgi:DNA repair exonuclease SbcCD ATPase subunit
MLIAVAVPMVMLLPGCNRSDKTKEVKEIQDLSQKAAELENLKQQANTVGTQENRDLARANLTEVPNPATLQLTDEQRTALEARLKVEKSSSYQALLQEVLDKDKEIKTINTKIAQLRAVLPRPEVAGPDDSHYGLAMRFLRKKGVGEEKAKMLIAKVLILDKMEPGFEVYHFYANGVYGTWVAQGKADISPTQLQADDRAKVTGERDAANQKAEDLQARIVDLNTEAEKIAADVDALRAEKTQLTAQLTELSAANQAQQSMLNSVHYLVGSRKTLVHDGVIVVPVFARDRAGANWNDESFTKSADLRAEDSVTFSAADAGLNKIGKVDVVPGSLEQGKHYILTLNEDRTVATVKFLAKDRFRNEKVVFALAD